MSCLSDSVYGCQGRENRARILTLGAMLTALVIVLQLLGSAIHFGPFSINLALVPIVIGAALIGPLTGAWLGLINALVILLSGDAAAFMSISVFGTLATVIVKGVMAGLCAGVVYKLISHVNQYAAVILAALICPAVNTGIFLLGTRLFFWDTIIGWGTAQGYHNAWTHVIVGMVGVNFLIELAVNIVLAPAIARILGQPSNRNTAFVVYGIVFAIFGLAVTVFSIGLMKQVAVGENVGGVLNPKTRYMVLTVVSSVVLAVGCLLTGIGLISGKKKSS